jgi:hypothetical protein
MNSPSSLILKSAALMWLVAASPIGDAVAQQRQRIFFHASGENSVYTQQYGVDVRDMPGHRLLVYEIRRTFPAYAPIVNGLAIKEIWTRGMADYTEENGHGTLYSEYLLENGDRFFSIASVIAHRTGLDEFRSNTVGRLSGGTGKVAGIEGTLVTTATTHPKAGTLEVDTEIQYTVGTSAVPK